MKEAGQNTITLITTVRGNDTSLPATLDSVLAQSRKPDEHIIVVGEDGSGSVLGEVREYARRAPYAVNILRREPNGVYDAINAGLERASCDIVGLLHAKDRFASDTVLERMAGAFDQDGELQIAYADIVYERPDGRPGRYYSACGYKPVMLKWGIMPPHPSVYVRRSLFGQYGMYPTDYRVAGDFEWLVRTFLKGGERHRYLPLCAVRMAVGGLSSKWCNRFMVTPREKLRALRANGYKVCPLRMAARYAFALATYSKPRHD